MKKIDITERVIQARQKLLNEEHAKLQNMQLPACMQQPFDEHFHNTPNNVVTVDFSQHTLEIPKALAAASAAQVKTPWYDQGVIAFKDTNGAILNIIFNKVSHSNEINVTVTVSDGESGFLRALARRSDLHCSLYDKGIALASLHASVNFDGTFMYAEGTIIEEYEPADCDHFISLKFH